MGGVVGGGEVCGGWGHMTSLSKGSLTQCFC